MIRSAVRTFASALVAAAMSGCSSPPPQTGAEPPAPPAPGKAATVSAPAKAPVELAYEEALSATDEDSLNAALSKLKAVLPRVDQDFVTEGDLLRSEDQLEADVRAARRDRQLRAQGKPPAVPIGPELVAAKKPNGTLDYWDASQRTLTYAIDRNSFKDPQRAALVETHIKRAVADWEAACTPAQKCDLKFVFRDDPAPTHQNNRFIVKQVNSQGLFIAAAFFPSYPSARRFLSIDPSFFTTHYDKTGVLRHELGHVIGYRHEQIRDIPGCKQEGTQWVPLTPYDPHSVMHYMCGGGGTLSLQLTDLDKRGHVAAYGKP